MTDIADIGGAAAGLVGLDETGVMGPVLHPPCCACAETEDDMRETMMCMPRQVFVFCILLSALASGMMVASQGMWDRLRRTLDPVNVRIRRSYASVKRSRASVAAAREARGAESMKALKAMDRASPAPLERIDEVPPRYVRAFCGNEKHASERWKATLQWRKENGIDSILNEFQPHFHDIRRHFPSYMSGRSRGGQIVVYEKLGGVDMGTLSREYGVTVPDLLRHWIFVSEYMYRVLQPTDSAQQINIEDMKGVRMQSLAGKIQEYIKSTAQLARLYYVERCHKTFVVNAPAWFGIAFRIVSPFLSAKTRQKIRILGADMSPLLNEIDAQFLPVEYGGKCTIPVSDSPEEKELRLLVHAINTEAAIDTKGHESDGAGSNFFHRQSSARKQNKRILPNNAKNSHSFEGVTRSRHGNKDRQPAAATSKNSKQRSIWEDSRLRARTDSPSSRNDDADPDVNRSSTPRRATWTDSNGTPVEYDLKREGADAVAPGGRRHAPMVGNETISGGHGTDLDHVRAVGHDWPPNSPCDSREGSSSVGDDMGFALPSPALQEVGHGASDGSKGNIRGGDGQREARAQSRDIEQRLQSVMEDLGVPVRESMESAESRSRSLPRRSKPPAMNGVEQNRPKSEKRERIELGGDGPLRDKQFLCDDGVGAAEGEVERDAEVSSGISGPKTALGQNRHSANTVPSNSYTSNYPPSHKGHHAYAMAVPVDSQSGNVAPSMKADRRV